MRNFIQLHRFFVKESKSFVAPFTFRMYVLPNCVFKIHVVFIEMRMWATEIQAIDPIDGVIKSWGGPNVPGINHEDAERYCQQNGLGYCRILGELVAEVPFKEGTNEPDMDKMVDYENINNN